MAHNDTDLRIRLLEYVPELYLGCDYFAAAEARYSVNARRADVLVVADQTHAFEIKSDVDRLDRLPAQMNDYRQTFDLLTVVTTHARVEQVEKLIEKTDGLLIIDASSIQFVRRPKLNKNLSKANIISMCSKAALKKSLNVDSHKAQLSELQLLAEKMLSTAEAKAIAFDELSRRFRRRYEIFLEEARIPYRECDLSLLRHSSRLPMNLQLDQLHSFQLL
jgi:hypothetical protein